MAAKVLIIGPQRCGKTRIANCLSDFEASPNFEQYNQTSGVRILESERVIRVEGRSVRQQVRPVPRAPEVPPYSPAHARTAAQVELWDCSGDKKYENCWPAILRDAHGVIMVYDPTVKTQEKDIELWHKAFVHGMNLPDSQARDAATPPPGPLLVGSTPHPARRSPPRAPSPPPPSPLPSPPPPSPPPPSPPPPSPPPAPPPPSRPPSPPPPSPPPSPPPPSPPPRR